MALIKNKGDGNLNTHTVTAEKFSGEEVVDDAGFSTDSNVHVISLFAESVEIVIPFGVFGFPRRLVGEYFLWRRRRRIGATVVFGRRRAWAAEERGFSGGGGGERRRRREKWREMEGNLKGRGKSHCWEKNGLLSFRNEWEESSWNWRHVCNYVWSGPLTRPTRPFWLKRNCIEKQQKQINKNSFYLNLKCRNTFKV